MDLVGKLYFPGISLVTLFQTSEPLHKVVSQDDCGLDIPKYIPIASKIICTVSLNFGWHQIMKKVKMPVDLQVGWKDINYTQITFADNSRAKSDQEFTTELYKKFLSRWEHISRAN